MFDPSLTLKRASVIFCALATLVRGTVTVAPLTLTIPPFGSSTSSYLSDTRGDLRLRISGYINWSCKCYYNLIIAGRPTGAAFHADGASKWKRYVEWTSCTVRLTRHCADRHKRSPKFKRTDIAPIPAAGVRNIRRIKRSLVTTLVEWPDRSSYLDRSQGC